VRELHVTFITGLRMHFLAGKNPAELRSAWTGGDARPYIVGLDGSETRPYTNQNTLK
jgi:hypothetical protein